MRFAQGWLAQVALTASAAAHAGGSGQDALLRLVSNEWSPLVWRFVLTVWTVTTLAAAAGASLSGSIAPALARIAPRWRRLAPREALAKLVSFESASHAVLCSAALVLSVAAIISPIRAAVPQLVGRTEFLSQASGGFALLATIWWRIAAILLCLGSLDVLLQQQRTRRRLRMTPREVREDRAETETKPELKQQRRAIGAKRSRGLRLAAIRRASAIVTNPTHVAVALRYAPPAVDVPIVVARGAERTAALIREIAAAHGIPVIESAELARRLYAHVEIDDPIPEEYYAAVAAVFAWIIRTHGQLPRGDEAEIA